MGNKSGQMKKEAGNPNKKQDTSVRCCVCKNNSHKEPPPAPGFPPHNQPASGMFTPQNKPASGISPPQNKPVSGISPPQKRPTSGTSSQSHRAPGLNRFPTVKRFEINQGQVKQVLSETRTVPLQPIMERSLTLTRFPVSQYKTTGMLRRTLSSRSLLGTNPRPRNRRAASIERIDEISRSIFGAQLPMPLQHFMMSTKLKTIVGKSWGRVVSFSPDIVDKCMSEAALAILKKPVNKVKKDFPMLENDLLARKTVWLACEKEHMHQTINAMSMIISHLNNHSLLAKVLCKLGARHLSYGVCDRVFMECFMAIMSTAVLQFLKKEHACDEDYLQAWTLLQDLVIFYTCLGLREIQGSESSAS